MLKGAPALWLVVAKIPRCAHEPSASSFLCSDRVATPTDLDWARDFTSKLVWRTV